MRSSYRLLFVLCVLIVAASLPAFAGPVPSKTAANQSLEARNADIALVREFAAREDVAKALAAQGFDQADVESKLAALSNEDLRSLAQNLEQVEAAGLTREQWIWVGVGALAALLLVVLL